MEPLEARANARWDWGCCWRCVYCIRAAGEPSAKVLGSTPDCGERFVRGIAPWRRYRTIGTNGRFTCRWCRGNLTNKQAYYCSKECCHNYRIRSSESYIRICLLQRDHGVCAECGTDTIRETGDRLPTYFEVLDPKELKSVSQIDYKLIKLGDWEADHILPVIDGGGDCGLDNLQTLCCRCHKQKTTRLSRLRTAWRSHVQMSTPGLCTQCYRSNAQYKRKDTHDNRLFHMPCWMKLGRESDFKRLPLHLKRTLMHGRGTRDRQRCTGGDLGRRKNSP